MGVEDEYGEDGKPTGDAAGESEGEGAPSIMAQTWKDGEGDAPEAKPWHIDDILSYHHLECPDECAPVCQEDETALQEWEAVGGFFAAIFLVDEDPAGHEPFVNMPGEMTLQVDVSPETGQIAISGPEPFVSVSGTIADGQFSASGSGTVAGFPGISFLFEGTVNSPPFQVK